MQGICAAVLAMVVGQSIPRSSLAAAATVEQSIVNRTSSELAEPPHASVTWTETSVQDFRDGVLDPMMYVSHRQSLDPDSGCVEFFARFDVDNNGYTDLACADDSGPYLRLYFGSASGYDSLNSRYYPVPGGGNVDLADLNLDGRAEMIHSGWRSGHVTIYWGTDSGPSPSDTTWLGISGQSEAVAVCDLDRDSYLDILAGSDNGNIYIFWGSAAGYSTANRSSVFLGGSVGHNLEIADFDKDGCPDIAASLWSRNRNPIIYWGSGRSPRTITWLPFLDNNPHGITVADFDRDGWLDVVYTGYDAVNSAYIYYGSAAGFSTGNREIINPGSCYGGSSAVHWNADKTLDLVFFRGDWGKSVSYLPKVYTNRADTTPHFSDARSSSIGDSLFNSSGGFVGDLNYDGYLDVFVNNMQRDGHSYILWGPYFNAPTALPVNSDHHGLWREAGNIYTRNFDATYVSSVFDVGPDSAVGGGTCSWIVDQPPGSSVGIEVRSGNTATPDSTWTEFYPVPMSGSQIPDPVAVNRYLQYRVDFNYARPCYLPSLERISFDLAPILAVDVGVTRIFAPVGTADSAALITPRVEVRNYELSSPSVRATLRIGSGYIRTVTHAMLPLATDTISFPAWTALPLGRFAVRCSVYAEYDYNPANDTLSDTVRVRVNSDAGPTAILVPPTACESGTVHVPAATVRNFGQRPEVFPVAMQIGAEYLETVYDTLASGQTDTVTFPAWTAEPKGLLAVRCFTSLASDINRANDTIARTTNVYTDIDAATIAIIAPVDTVDSGTVIPPSARIANLGTSSALIPVRLRIGSTYNQTTSVTVQPGETLTVTFPNWTATPLGTHAVRCSTYLTGDTIAGNNLKTDSVTVIARRDAWAVAILAPTGNVDSGTVITPVCRIANDGISPASIPVRLRIGAAYEQTRTKLLAAGVTDTVHFPDWTASPLGTLAVQCSTALAGDEDPLNDTASTTVYVGVVIDAAAQAVIAPSGTVDSGTAVTPVCRIANLSTSPKTIPVTLRIGSGYTQTRTKSLAPSAADTVMFPVWTASPLGTHPVRCTTALAGDTFPDNDTADGSVTVIARVDAALTAILVPTDTVDSGVILTPAVSVTNNSTRTELVPVRITISPLYSRVGAITLAPGQTDTLYFLEWPARQVGTHNVVAFTYLTGDENTANDTVRTTVTVVRNVDAASVTIIAPTGSVDSGTVITPRASVTNNGTSTASIPVRLSIGPAYAESVSVSVSPHETLAVSFADWTAQPVGLLGIRCSTGLAGDVQPANDTVSGTVRVTTTIDAAAIAILAPTDTVDSGTVITPRARVANLGRNTALIPVRMTVGSVYAESVTVSVSPSETLTVSFANWTASPLGTLAVRCSTMLTGDTSNANDLQAGTVTVIAHRDARAVAILAPTGNVDSGAVIMPVCRIANDGTSPASIPVRLRIGVAYEQTRTKLLAAGATDTVHFPDWTASPPGLLAVRCSTALAGDEQPLNDTVSSWIYVGTRIDAAALAIMVPTDTLDSGTVVTPACSIICLSTSPKLVPATLRIGTGYQQTRTKFMLPLQQDTFQFPNWVASPLGLQTVRCSTGLAGDTFPANDTADGSVTVVAPVRIDAELTAIIVPLGSMDSGAVVTPRVAVTNLGNRAQVIPVQMAIDPGYVQFDTVTLSASETDTVSFPPWTAEPVGILPVVANTYLADDTNPANDTARTTITVIRHLDAASVRIIAPTGSVDSGTVVTPRASVTNNGTSTALVPVRLTIASDYAASETVSVAPSETTTVAFTDWTARPVGQLEVRCSTGLAADENALNDTVSGTVRVNRVPVLDVGATAILTPPDIVDSGTAHTPSVVVTNFGNTDTSFPVALRIGSGYAQTVAETLAAGLTDTVAFPVWTAEPCGSLPIVCFTSLAGDMNPANDTVYDAVTVNPIIDAAAVSLLAPAGTIDSGTTVTPLVSASNLGSHAVLVPVRLTIGTGYADTTALLLAPGQTDTFSFRAWTASPVGVNAVRCSVQLAGDQHPENDTLRDSAVVIRHLDAASVRIIAPLGDIDSGLVLAPMASVTNNGTSSTPIPVRLTIGSGYASIETVTVAPRETTTVVFADWTATPLGILAVRCSTRLAGDENAPNDTVSTSLRIRRPVLLDVGVTAILSPPDTVDTATVQMPSAVVRNFGNTDTSFPVTFRINGAWERTVAETLAAGASDTVSFPSWTAAPCGTLPIACFTDLDGDDNPDNDTAYDDVLVRPMIDAMPVAILAPAGTLDSGTAMTPMVSVRNLGPRTETVPLRLQIGSGYVDTVQASLAPGQTDTFAFASWVASPVGIVAVRCSTQLVGDQHPENDTLSRSVTVEARVDAELRATLSPTGTYDSGATATPTVTVRNNGTRAETIPIRMTIGSTYAEYDTVTLAPGATDTTFFPVWAASPVGILQVVANTSLADDENPANDTARTTVTVIRHIDAASVAIIAPTGSVDSGTVVTPRASVTNNGTSAALVPVRLTIGSGYAASETVSVAPSETTTVAFADWTARPAGQLGVRCSTGLADDEQPLNDTVSDTLRVNRPLVLDVGATLILAPRDTVDSGTIHVPAAVVHNFGNRDTFFPVTFRIGSTWSRNVQETLAVGGTDTVSFPSWTAQPCSTLSIVCFTGLAGDMNPANDTAYDTVTVRPVIDAAAVSLLAPAGTIDSGTTVTPLVSVSNLGSHAALVPVRLTIGTSYADTTALLLAPGQTDTFAFASWVASPVGVIAVRCSAQLAGDQHPENDTVNGEVNVVTHRDAASVSIIAPTGTVDSGTVMAPQAIVANLGSSTALIPAILRIGATYTDTAELTLAPGEQDTISFSPWTASPLGNLTVRCSTALAGDEDPLNDTVSTNVTVRLKVDAAALVVLSPTGTLDSGTVIVPMCSVANYSTREQLVRARLWIGPVYNQVRTKLMAPGQIDTFVFMRWTASPVGSVAVRCSTRLTGDQYPENDTADASVLVVRRIDAGVTAILAPSGNLDSGTVVTPVCRIVNLSTSARLIPVEMRIGSGYADTTSKLLAPGATDTVRFSDWTASPLGVLAVRCSTQLAGDGNPLNDTLSGSVAVGTQVNAAALAIIAPLGTVDSGIVITPVCRIANYSTSPKTVPVNLAIGTLYSSSRSKFLLPSQADTVAFADWTASPLGTHAVVCSTALAGDTNPADDRIADSVTVTATIDAATISILVPSDTVDSGATVSPQAVVSNLGTSPALVPVLFRIGTMYEQTMNESLAAGQTDTITFAAWQASTVGTFAMVCSTGLAGDLTPENDMVRGTVTVRALIDAASIVIIAPVGIHDSGTTVTPAAVVANNSSHAQDVPVILSIGSGYTDTTVISLAPLESDTVWFADWLATPPGTWLVRCSTALAGDRVPENDTVSSTVQVRRVIDASVTAILAPTGSLDSGTAVMPRALVANLGTAGALIPVTMRIGSSYVQSEEVTLNPGETDTVSFMVWTASPLGWQVVRCSSALSGDMNNSNDQQVDSVLVGVHVDAGAVAILAPTGTVDSGTVIVPSCLIANYSTSPKLVPARLTIGTGYSDTASRFVLPGATDTVSFASWTAGPIGLSLVRCSVALSGDENPANDTASGSVSVVARIDAGVTAILAPTGTVDSGSTITPVCRIVNNSISPKLVPVTLTIGGFYANSRVKFLSPGQEDTVRFAYWVADQLGTHAVRCSTALSGDEDPLNDTMSTAVSVRVRLDAAVLQILAPTGTVDSGSTIAPQAVIANYSMRKVAIPIHMLVSNGYHESTTVAIDVGASRTITFPDWPASPVGRFIVTCSTALAGDIDPNNDTLRGSVTVAPRHDVGCYLILAPTGTVDSAASVTPRAMVTNFGLGPELVPVRMTIGTAYLETRDVNVSAGESLMVAFASWTASPTGMLAVRCSTMLAGDTVTANDMAFDSVRVITHPDVAVTDIYAPLGTVDSGSVITPYARICNFGSSPVTTPVRMRIGSTYYQTRDKYLGVGAKDTVTFPDWVASPLGTSVVTCSTALAGDTNPANDYKTGSVTVLANRDAAVLAILAPTGRVDSGSAILPQVLVANYGASSSFIPVRMHIAGNYDSLATKWVNAGATDTVTFPAWTASPIGTQPVRCSTEVVGDRERSNDATSDSVFVGVRRDAASIEIQVPAGVLDSGQVVRPVAVIANYSTSGTEIPVLLRIGSDYAKSRRKLLAPMQRDTVMFPNWTAHPVGVVAVSCSTALYQDERRKNDVVRIGVTVQNVRDAAVTEIIVPIGSLDSGRQVTPKAWIANYGQFAQAIPVEMRIGDFYRSVRTKTLAPGASDTVWFENWDVSQIGHHAVRCSTMVDMDANPANDFKDTWADVEWRDAGCVSILSPLSIVPADTTVIPKARVRNFGTRTERVPAVFRAGFAYAQLAFADSLAPGDSADLTFPPLVIPVGEMTVSCSTALAPDMHRENDKLSLTVFAATRDIVLERDSACEVMPGAIVNYNLTCYNNGDAEDTIDLTRDFTNEGWLVEFLDSTGATALADHNNNGMPDLGPVPSHGSARFTTRITVPAHELGHRVDSTAVRASSGSNFNVSDQVRLTTTVKAIANLLIDPDQFGTAPPGSARDYTMTITNLGNVADYADLSLYGTRRGWSHQLLDAEGKSLGDKNHNGRKDVGPVAPFGGTTDLTLEVAPDYGARLGDTDTSFVSIQSFEDEQVRDSVVAITQAAGAITALVIDPDQTGAIPVGETGTYRLSVLTSGNIVSTVNLSVSSSLPGWQVTLLDDAGTTELRDTDRDGNPDLGSVAPASPTYLTCRVTTPGSADLVGNVDSLLTATVRITASLSGAPTIADSALLRITAVPKFEVHNSSNPFRDRTRFVLSIPTPGRVNLVVYNRLGEVLKRLVDNQPYTTGVYSLEWDGTNDAGKRLAPGIYLYLLELLPTGGLPQRTVNKAVIKR